MLVRTPRVVFDARTTPLRGSARPLGYVLFGTDAQFPQGEEGRLQIEGARPVPAVGTVFRSATIKLHLDNVSSIMATDSTGRPFDIAIAYNDETPEGDRQMGQHDLHDVKATVTLTGNFQAAGGEIIAFEFLGTKSDSCPPGRAFPPPDFSTTFQGTP